MNFEHKMSSCIRPIVLKAQDSTVKAVLHKSWGIFGSMQNVKPVVSLVKSVGSAFFLNSFL